MPADIRSFFGGSQPSSSNKAKPPAKKPDDSSSSRKRRSRKVVEDSDEDEAFEPAAPAPKPLPKKKQKPEEPKGEPTTTSAYFASSKKNKGQPKGDKPSEAQEPKPDTALEETAKSTPRTKKTEEIEIPVRSPPSTRKTPKRGAAKATRIIDDEEELGGDDIFATGYRKVGKGGDDDYMEDDGSDFEEMEVEPPKAASPKLKPTKATPAAKDTKAPSRNGRKRKSEVLGADEESDDYAEAKKKPSRAQAQKSPSKPAARKPKAVKTGQPESKEIQDIFDSIPLVRPPSPPAGDGNKKFNFAAQRSRDPATSGAKEIPVGAENCLAGLSFVFTGVLESLGREEGQSLVKRYGGKVTSGPSSKTSYVVLGDDAGPKKIETIKKFGLKTINEDGLFELIRRLPPNGGDGKAAEQHAAKKKAEEQRIKDMAAEIDREEKKKAEEKKNAAALAAPPGKAVNGPSKTAPPPVDDRLWTTKYAPTSLNMICGNKTVVEKLQSWLRNWRDNAKADFRKPGKEGTGLYRAVMIHGPPGIGKTTAAHLVAKLENYDVVETNASDTRSKGLLEAGLKGVLDTTSLQGYFSGQGKKVESHKKNLVLVMDEVDGMSAGDRGGVGALASVAKKTRIPMILICNERRLPKMKPFDHVTYDLQFRRPTVEQIRARLSTICYREGLKIPPQVLDSLIQGTHADIRQVINMLSTARLDQKTLDYDQGKEMSKAWEKHVILKPWDIVGKILSAQMFAQSSNSSLNEKIELYFNDHEFSYLMLQENYLNTRPSAANAYQGREQRFKLLELVDNAAESISDGDLVDRMIHGTQQQWSLMPTHAVFSFVRPASFVAGNMSDRPGFTSWLGNNSKQGKMARQVKEIQGHMRLRASGDRHEIRQQYMPALWNKIVRPLQDEGKESVEEVIDLMDSYFLTREDWDSISELGLGSMDQKNLKIDSQTKATFTRLYNQQSHPLPFMKGTSVVAPKHVAKVKPDLEDAIDESDEGEEILGAEETKGDDESDLDLKKDKYVKLPKKKAPAKKGKAAAKPQTKKTKRKAADDDDEEGSEEDVTPKKGAGRGRKPKGKA
ncbi:hypothetical protein AJ79_09113 [Helicocarpus griseus UAMH5409]|uniref:Replication factor C subunit 1 n=1 Tax=Helicocarpus griseus UAMH5409 TaxID=1447875 RepID=A0A2B7WLR4_9EURO|nr:hypothetical protein AJ79_09113 [Helicocarpus griseus UAMH5409]